MARQKRSGPMLLINFLRWQMRGIFFKALWHLTAPLFNGKASNMLLQLYNHYYILRFFRTQTGVAKKICSYVWVCMSTSQVMSAFKPHPSANFSPSYFHVIPGHPSVCLSSLLSFGTHHRLHEIVVPHSSVPKLYDSWVRTKHYPTLNTLIAKRRTCE